jgi:pimeloyl-ACP methyl ester carboxylesterase
MMKRLVPILAAVAVAVALAGCAGGEVAASGARPTIVIEHGAFADASGWRGVIARLERHGYRVLAPANPLRGVASDAAYLRSVLDTIRAPVVLVGHSYGGAVITNAATGAPNVKALVYVAAVAPDAGESQADIFARFPGSRLGPSTLEQRPSPGGVDQYVKRRSYRAVFAADQPRGAARTMAATQRPLAAAAATQASGAPAWRSIPSWFMVATQDRAIPPAAQRSMARRAGAHTVAARSPHFVMLSHPRAVTRLILRAARHARATP